LIIDSATPFQLIRVALALDFVYLKIPSEFKSQFWVGIPFSEGLPKAGNCWR
jgi:hypothetical protein